MMDLAILIVTILAALATWMYVVRISKDLRGAVIGIAPFAGAQEGNSGGATVEESELRRDLFLVLLKQQQASFALLFFALVVAICVFVVTFSRLMSSDVDVVKSIASLSTAGIEAGLAGGAWKLFEACNKRLFASRFPGERK